MHSIKSVLDDGIIRLYGDDSENIDLGSVGTWAIPFVGKELAVNICKSAIGSAVVDACACDSNETGYIYLYVDGTSEASQRSLIAWLLQRDLLPRNERGELVELYFSYDISTTDSNGADAQLSDYIDLSAGELR